MRYSVASINLMNGKNMIDAKNINQIIQNIIENLPDGLKNMPTEINNNFIATLHNIFERLDLVTREEFDVQQKVLLRTREKLEKLEKKIAELEE